MKKGVDGGEREARVEEKKSRRRREDVGPDLITGSSTSSSLYNEPAIFVDYSPVEKTIQYFPRCTQIIWILETHLFIFQSKNQIIVISSKIIFLFHKNARNLKNFPNVAVTRLMNKIVQFIFSKKNIVFQFYREKKNQKNASNSFYPNVIDSSNVISRYYIYQGWLTRRVCSC